MSIKQHVKKLEKFLLMGSSFSKAADYFLDHLDPKIHSLIYGFCVLGGRDTLVIYFGKSDMALLVVSPSDPEGEIDYFRFRFVPMEDQDQQLYTQTAPGIQ